MEVTYCLFFFFLMLMCSGMDGLQTGNVLLPLGTIKNDGIRMRNDQPIGIYLKSDQVQPLTLRTRYYPLPPPPHRRLQQQLNSKQQGFIIRNSIGRHPPRPAPVSINNHLGALTGGHNPGRGKFHHANRQQKQKPLKQHLNHQFQTVNMPTNIHYSNKQPTGNHQTQQNGQIRAIKQPDSPSMIAAHTKSPKEDGSDPLKMMSNDAAKILKFELEGNDYLTYLYLGMNETRLDGEEYLKTSAASYTGDKVTHPPPTGDDDIIIGSPTMHYFDPYLSRNQSFRSKSSSESAGDHDRTILNENVIKSLDDDWLPIASPWDKYGNKSEESKVQ